MAGPRDAQATGTVARTVRLMAMLADQGGEVRVNQLAEKLNLAPSTVHRLLALLREEGIVASNSDTRTYSIGASFYRIASRVVATTQIAGLAQPHLQELAQRFDETVLFGLYLKAEQAVSFTARADGQQVLQYRIDMNVPLSLLWGASGKAILAQLPDATVEEILARGEPSPATSGPPPALHELTAELQQIRRAGCAISDSEKLSGARGIAAPVFGATGAIGCLVLTSPRDRLPNRSLDEISAAIIASAAELSTALGAPPTAGA